MAKATKGKNRRKTMAGLTLAAALVFTLSGLAGSNAPGGFSSGFSAGFSSAAYAAGGWQALSDEAMDQALVARTLGFPDGTTWGFFADGRILTEEAWGRWQIGDETLCLNWPGSDTRCYQLESQGLDLRFTPLQGGQALVGRYTDL